MELRDVYKLKDEGNKFYNQGCKTANSSLLKQACQMYAKAIENLSPLESSISLGVGTHDELKDFDELSKLKVTLFLNLAASNLKLDNFEGARRCCNASLLFLNRPLLSLEDMGVEDDLTVDIDVFQPIPIDRITFVLKALYRRSKCLLGLGLLQNARADLLLAKSLLPETGSNEIQNDIDTSLVEIEHLLNHSAEVPSVDDSYEMDLRNHEEQAMKSLPVTNGGFCMIRKGIWCQTVQDATVYLPTSLFTPSISLLPQANDRATKNWTVEFEEHAIKVIYSGNLLCYETLEHNIIPSKCYWMFESFDSNDKSSMKVRFLVLHLHKATSFEWFPGCEWWDRVFPADEAIDTLSCSVGAEIAQLPAEARQRAEREHHLFMALDKDAQQAALDQLQHSKQLFERSEKNIRTAAQEEERAIAEVPERAQMLMDLRKEFPNIDFTAK